MPRNKLQGLGEGLEKSLALLGRSRRDLLTIHKSKSRVGRRKRPKRGGAHDLVNVADVGFGVFLQTLPVVVALRAARPGQLLYIEQPEIHLASQSTSGNGPIASQRRQSRCQGGCRETHSSLLLIAVQALVAEEKLEPSRVMLSWFLRGDSDGRTHISSADLDRAGRFGDWPEDFGEIALEAENRYLSAAEGQR